MSTSEGVAGGSSSDQTNGSDKTSAKTERKSSGAGTGVPQVVIIGRPNVGKSSIFNWLAGRRLAIVDPTAGVTRDRVTQLLEMNERFVELVDTGGMGIKDSDNLTDHIEHQIELAIDTAAVILFVVDSRSGLLPMDEDVARRLRHVTVPVLCVANKTDTDAFRANADEFYRVGRKVIPVSAEQSRGKSDLLDAIAESLPEPEEGDSLTDAVMKVAIVGRQNTGKSTFINTLARAERMITSEVPGTTRDSVDVRFELEGRTFMAIDTPGFRRRHSVTTDLGFYSTHRAERSIRRADVVFLFFDGSQRISKVDKQLCDYIAQQYKPCIFVVNKWDLMANTMPTEKWAQYVRDTFRTMHHVPIAFVSGETGRSVKALVHHAHQVFEQSRARVTTGQLNKIVQAALERNPPPLGPAGRTPKIYYATQVAIQPPTLVLFCNEPRLLSTQYQRYLLGFFRDQLPFAEVPIKLYLRHRQSAEAAEENGAKHEKPERE